MEKRVSMGGGGGGENGICSLDLSRLSHRF